MSRVETDKARCMAINLLGNGLADADHHEDALSVGEAELSTLRRLGASERNILAMQSNLANIYDILGRHKQALWMEREVYSGFLKLNGEENEMTLVAANNYANMLVSQQHHQEAKSLLRKTMPVAQRVLREGRDTTLRMKTNYAMALYRDAAATLKDLREAVTTLEDADRIARRVLGGAHPLTEWIEPRLQDARAALRARETPPEGA
ncbi:unnamed protein product [Pelagomonas calceolata]|uniref:Tetratricopeptide repeat protein n=1 Tax=Pelagomonas calceolata TaxID=35677 RepID=A0A8J2WZ98_9STRA|nr:unnamed protein product [Pelagomonas calceolata]